MKRKIAIFILATILLVTAMPASYAAFPVDIPVPEFKAAGTDTANMQELNAYNKGMELLMQSIFSDTASDPFEKNILRLAVQDVAKRSDNSNFRPEEDVTGFEVLTYLMRLNGSEAAVQQAVLPQTGGLSQGAIRALYNENYAQQALNNGVLLATEYTGLNEPVDREQIALWIARLLNLQPNFGNLDNVFGFQDFAEVTPENRGLIEALIEANVMKPNNDGNFNPMGMMSRGELMETLDVVSEQLYDQNNITTGYGLVTGVQENETQEVGYKVTTRDLIIRTVDGQTVKVSTSLNTKTNQRMEFVSYKNGVPSDSRVIEIGDEVQYLAKNDAVVYVEVINDNTVLEKMRRAEENGTNIKTYFGHIYEILSKKEWITDRFIEQSRYRVRTFEGETFDLVVETDLYTGVKNDPIVYKEDRVAGASLLAVGDDITFAVKDDETLVYVNVKPMEQLSISGTVRSVATDTENNRTTLEIFGYDNQIWTFPVASYAGVEVNLRVGALKDLRYGQDVKVTVNQGFITNVVSETFMENPGYIPKYGKMRQGQVYIKYSDVILFKLNDGRQQAYKIPDGIPMTKGGTSITKAAIKEGDKVKLYFDDIYTDEASKIEVEGIDRLVKNIYKGTLGSVNEALNEVTLYQPMYLKNTAWVAETSFSKKIKLTDDVLIYQGEKLVPFRELERTHRGDTVYVALEDNFGTELAEMMTIKSGGENVFNDTIRSYSSALNSFELYNRMNFNLTEGTIVVKEGRLVETNRIKKQDTVMVVSDFYQGANNANVVKLVSDADDIFERIYIGALEDVNGNSVTLRNWSTMSGNEWNGIIESDSEKLYYHTETVVKDITKTPVQTITAFNFFNGSYSREDNKSTDGKGLTHERFYAVGVLTDKGFTTTKSLAGLHLRQNGLIAKVDWDDTFTNESKITEELKKVLEDSILTRGIVDSLDTQWNRVRITDSHDWIRSTAEWKGNSVDTYTEYTDAIVIRENEVIAPTDMQPGENIYVLRYKEDAFVIFVDPN